MRSVINYLLFAFKFNLDLPILSFPFRSEKIEHLKIWVDSYCIQFVSLVSVVSALSKETFSLHQRCSGQRSALTQSCPVQRWVKVKVSAKVCKIVRPSRWGVHMDWKYPFWSENLVRLYLQNQEEWVSDLRWIIHKIVFGKPITY